MLPSFLFNIPGIVGCVCVCVFSAKFVHFLFLKLAYTQHYTLINNGDHFESPLIELANSEVYNIIYRYMNVIYRVPLLWIRCDLFNQPLAGGYLGIPSCCRGKCHN